MALSFNHGIVQIFCINKMHILTYESMQTHQIFSSVLKFYFEMHCEKNCHLNF